MSGSLFQGTPQTATSYVTSTQEMPRWLQDAIYNQIQLSTNIANRPYTPYTGEAVADLTPQQQQAYQQVSQNVGAFLPETTFASAGMKNLSGATTAPQLQQAQSAYLQPFVGMPPFKPPGSGDVIYNRGNMGPGSGGAPMASTGKPGTGDTFKADLGFPDSPPGISVGVPGTPTYREQPMGFPVQPPMNQPGALAGYNLGAGQGYFAQAGGMDIPGAAQPLLSKAEATTGQSLAERALTAADPYLTAAGQTSASQVGQYMSPYQQGVLDVIAKQGARNLKENILPQVSDAFVRAGQFGSSRMGEFGSRAIRDTQEAVLNQQTQAAQQGYAQSLAAAQSDLARQAQLAGTVGSISGADLSRVMQGGAQFGNLGQTAGQLTGQQMQNLANLGQMQTGAGQAQQQFGLSAAQQVQQAQGQDLTRQGGALQSVADLARQTQALRTADVAALEAAGSAQQRQSQAELDALRARYEAEQMYPRQQLDWLSTQIRGMAPITPQPTTQTGSSTGQTYSPSPLSQLASGLYTYKGLQSLGI